MGAAKGIISRKRPLFNLGCEGFVLSNAFIVAHTYIMLVSFSKVSLIWGMQRVWEPYLRTRACEKVVALYG